MTYQQDSRGTLRGVCNQCPCPGYKLSSNGNDCILCSHKPVHHKDMGSGNVQPPSGPKYCDFPGCTSLAKVDKGQQYDYCSKDHAKQAAAMNKQNNKHSGGNVNGNGNGLFSKVKNTINAMITPLCALPGCNKPVFVENNVYHDYCCRTHRNDHEQQILQSYGMRKRFQNPNPGTCMFPQCNKPVFIENGFALDFCGRTHAKQFEDMQRAKFSGYNGPQQPHHVYQPPMHTYQHPVHSGPPPAYPGTGYPHTPQNPYTDAYGIQVKNGTPLASGQLYKGYQLPLNPNVPNVPADQPKPYMPAPTRIQTNTNNYYNAADLYYKAEDNPNSQPPLIDLNNVTQVPLQDPLVPTPSQPSSVNNNSDFDKMFPPVPTHTPIHSNPGSVTDNSVTPPTNVSPHPPQNPVLPRVILFYNRDEPYYEFTNFAEGCPITVEGIEYPTTEHYFQAHKFIEHPHLMEAIRTQRSPRDAFDTARKYEQYKRKDWEQAKENIMAQALHAKFTSYKYLMDLLLSTGDAILVENSPYDRYWGNGGDGSGENKLGIILMNLRAVFQQTEQSVKQN